MRVASERILTRLIAAGPAAMLRAGCIALVVCVSGCGGGADDAPPPSSMPTPAPTPAPGRTPLAPAAGCWHGAVARQRRERQSRQPACRAQRQRRWLRGLAGRRRHASQPLGQPLRRCYGRVGQPDQHRGQQRRYRRLRSHGRRQRQRGCRMARGAHGGSSAWRRGDERALRHRRRRVGHAGAAELRRQRSRASPATPTALCSPCTSLDRLLFAGASSTLAVAPGSRKLRSSRTTPAPASAAARRHCWTAAAMRSSPSKTNAPARWG